MLMRNYLEGYALDPEWTKNSSVRVRHYIFNDNEGKTEIDMSL
jgi:hypothetical protein